MVMVLVPVPVMDPPGLVILPVGSMGPVTRCLEAKEVGVGVVTMEATELVLDLLQATATPLASMVVGFQVLEVVAVAVAKEAAPSMAMASVPDLEVA
jgi:hypothetical protein